MFLELVKFSVVVVFVAYTVNWYLIIRDEQSLKAIEEDAEKGKAIVSKDAVSELFKIEYDQEKWDDLVRRLNSTKYFQALDASEASEFEFGFGVEYAKELVDYWRTKFDWKKQVKLLNKFNHYKIQIEGFNLHYLRVNTNKFKNSKRVPLLMINGWPGSFYEFYKAIDYISDSYNNEDQYFDIVVPSIPGYGFSIPLTKTINVTVTGRLYDALMRHLFGEDCKYFIDGEDWGSIIGAELVKMYPRRIKGFHTTMVLPRAGISTVLTNIFADLFPSFMLTTDELQSNISFSYLERFKIILRETGYQHLQATKPDTLGFGLTDSPVGLMTYMLEKFSSWSFSYKDEILKSKDGGLRMFSKDDLLTIVTLYWMTNTITSSVRYYKCSFEQILTDMTLYRLPTPESVPVAVALTPHELDHSPYTVLKTTFSNLTQYTLFKTGGHFLAFHETKAAVDDLMKFINLVK